LARHARSQFEHFSARHFSVTLFASRKMAGRKTGQQREVKLAEKELVG